MGASDGEPSGIRVASGLDELDEVPQVVFHGVAVGNAFLLVDGQFAAPGFVGQRGRSAVGFTWNDGLASSALERFAEFLGIVLDAFARHLGGLALRDAARLGDGRVVSGGFEQAMLRWGPGHWGQFD